MSCLCEIREIFEKSFCKYFNLVEKILTHCKRLFIKLTRYEIFFTTLLPLKNNYTKILHEI